MPPKTTPEEIAYLLEKARGLSMSAEQEAEQRRSFAYGNSAFENPRITRQMIEEEERKLGAYGG